MSYKQVAVGTAGQTKEFDRISKAKTCLAIDKLPITFDFLFGCRHRNVSRCQVGLMKCALTAESSFRTRVQRSVMELHNGRIILCSVSRHQTHTRVPQQPS